MLFRVKIEDGIQTVLSLIKSGIESLESISHLLPSHALGTYLGFFVVREGIIVRFSIEGNNTFGLKAH